MTVTCYNCGATTEPEQKFCEACGAKVTSEPSSGQRWPGTEPAVGPPVTPSPPVAASPPPMAQSAPSPGPTLPGSPIRLGDGERVLRQYRAVQLRHRRRGEGMLYVTDARIVFFARAQGRGTQRASSLVQQTRLQDVSGLEAFVSRRTNLLLLLFTMVMGLAALGSLATSNLGGFIVFFLITGIAIFAMYNGAAERGRAGVRIHARQSENSMGYGAFENRRSMLETLLTLFIFPLLLILRAQTAFDVQFGRPGDDSDLLIAELGALVLDLQTRGELAATYWAGPAVPATRAGAPTASPTQVLS